jgi:hypothetical protein
LRSAERCTANAETLAQSTMKLGMKFEVCKS